ncbi:MAG: hypothetical protein MI975_23020 [Cytophagales bacterium]|nr:hypothetical protein [Cytophagales bacterium]
MVERFSIEKLVELCHNKSLDSYRVRALNPKSSLLEVYNVLCDWQNNRIKDFKTVLASVQETISIITEDDTIKFGLSSKDSFLKLLKDIKNKNSIEHIERSEHSIYYLLNANENYLASLIEKLEYAFQQEPKVHGDKISLLLEVDQYLNYLLTELIETGYSKSYLLKVIQAIFVYSKESNFHANWYEFKAIITNKTKDPYLIIFAIIGSKSQLEKLVIDELKTEINPDLLGPNPQPKLSNFIKTGESKRFIEFEILALDYYQALKLAKSQMSNIFDKIHLGFGNPNLTIKERAIVLNKENPERGNLQPIHYHIDGFYQSNEELYRSFLSKLENIGNKDYISPEVQDRLTSAIRYFRLGNESLELEKKFMNYWIGLEFIFSSYIVNQPTFERLKKHFINCHLVHYTKRNLMQLHKDIASHSLGDNIENYDDNLMYLLDENILDQIISDFQEHTLLSYRCSRFKSHLLNNSEKRKDYLNKHKKHLEWHLIRLYRIRNELIHDAAIIENIENLTGNLRYFLSFMLNKIIEYFNDCIRKPNNLKKVTMNDFFHYQDMILEDFKNSQYDPKRLVSIPFSYEYFF